jgi:type I pantothenate kinase
MLFRQRQAFFNKESVVKTPYIIGIAGSVAVGKSTTARVLKELLARWPSSPKVDLVTTDGFLLPNEVLRRDRLMERKGFPDSYDVGALLRFLSSIKSGERDVRAPLYSHLTYDVLPGAYVTIDRPDILIFEGINVLQPGRLPMDGKFVPFLSDFFDFSIYIDADEALIHEWYIARFMRLRETAFRNPESFFHRYSQLSEPAARAIAEGLWANINLKNLRENILPTRPRADLILRKGANHLVEEVALRKL